MSHSAFWRQRPVLVTGATGLLGSALTRMLVEAGADLICLVRDWVPQSELVRSSLIDGVRVVRGDVVDQQLLERALGEYEIDTVMHSWTSRRRWRRSATSPDTRSISPTREPISVRQMVDRILRVSDRTDLEPVIQNQATHEIREQSLSASKARTMLRWRPRVTLDEGLHRAHAWYRDLLAPSSVTLKEAETVDSMTIPKKTRSG